MIAYRINTAIFWATVALLNAYALQNVTDDIGRWVSSIALVLSIGGLWWSTRKPRSKSDG